MKSSAIYICSECGNEATKWSGRCEVCGAWSTLKEVRIENDNKKSNVQAAEIYKFSEVRSQDFIRKSTGIGELDRVLGGGVVAGSVILLGGDPGIGKSTLALQLAIQLENICYVSGEESAAQVSLRYQRLNSNNKKEGKGNSIIAETNLEAIEKAVLKIKPDYLVIDSIQTMYLSSFPSTSGSLVQVRETAIRLVQLAKKNNIAIIIIGHVTKDGDIAGPKILEHMVDVVLYLEGERYHDMRILRGIKNRFGDSTEIGLFRMELAGLVPITNPSSELLAERLAGAGSVVTSTVEGTRPLLVEVQALTNQSLFGYPKRTASGFDVNRLNILLAVLKKSGINLNSYDVFINIIGGMFLREPSVDLAVIVSVVSSFKNKPIDKNLCIFGEVGLSGELRSVKFYERRVKEAERLGFSVMPKFNLLSEVIESLFIIPA